MIGLYGLSLDGGGIRGLIAIELLRRLLAKPEWKGVKWDMIAGTSTGGLIALMYSIGHSPSEILDAYRQYAPMIFSRPWWRRGLAIAKYSSSGIEQAAAEIFRGKQLRDCKIPVICVSHSIAKGRTKVFKSWTDGHEFLADVARATSAAPTYFAPTRDGLIDGGVWANNPSMCLLAEIFSTRGRGAPIERILSIGTGTDCHRPDPMGSGIFGWSREIITTLMDAGADGIEYQSRALLGDRYVRVQPSLGKIDPSMDRCDKAHMRALVALGEAWPL